MNARTHLVLGATGGIGAALTRRLAERGEQVFALARDESRLAQLAEQTGARTIAADARDPAAVHSAVERVLHEAGRLDGAACFVGSIVLKPLQMTTLAELEEVLRQNVYPAFNLVRAAAPEMAKRGGGALLLTSSVAARYGLAHHELIAAAKAAIEGLTRSAAASHAGRNVRVNAVAPGLVQTELSARWTSSPKALETSQAMHPLGRIGTPEEVASLADWLLSAEGSWATGQVFGLDGGLGCVAARR